MKKKTTAKPDPLARDPEKEFAAWLDICSIEVINAHVNDLFPWWCEENGYTPTFDLTFKLMAIYATKIGQFYKNLLGLK